jgi:hypothetical protein
MLTFDVSGEAPCQVVKASPKVEQEGGGISWDVDLAYVLNDEAEAEMLTSIFPSAVTAYMRAIDSKSESHMKATVPEVVAKLDMRLHGGEELVVGASVEVRSVELKCGAKAQVYTMRIRLKYLRSDFWVNLVQSLGETVIVSVRAAQQTLPISTKLPPEGRVVCAIQSSTGDEVYGVFRRGEPGALIVEDFDTYYKCDTIVTQVHIKDAGDMHIDDAIAKYAGLSEVRSWRSLINAIGEQVGQGTVEGNAIDGFVVTDATVQAALAGEVQAYRNRA